MRTSLTIQKETETLVTNQDGAISFLKTTPLQEGTTVFATSRERSSSLLVRRHQGQSAFNTTQVSPTIQQNYTHNLVAIVGHSISLSCSSPVKTRFLWGHRLPGSDKLLTIYNGHRITSSHQLALRMTASTCDVRMCTLHLHELLLGASGIFSCRRSNGYEYWSLTVLGKQN